MHTICQIWNIILLYIEALGELPQSHVFEIIAFTNHSGYSSPCFTMVFKLVFACVLFQAMGFTEGQVILADRCKAAQSANDDLAIKMKDLHLEVQQLRTKLQTTEDRFANEETRIAGLSKSLLTYLYGKPMWTKIGIF